MGDGVLITARMESRMSPGDLSVHDAASSGCCSISRHRPNIFKNIAELIRVRWGRAHAKPTPTRTPACRARLPFCPSPPRGDPEQIRRRRIESLTTDLPAHCGVFVGRPQHRLPQRQIA